MPTLRPDSIFQEYLFSPDEEIQSKILSPLLVCRLNNKYAELTKAQANSMIPTESIEDRAFMMSVMENSGKLNLITELFADHQEALRQMAARETPASPFSDVRSLEVRAAANVHNS